jgi:hypothetical protein
MTSVAGWVTAFAAAGLLLLSLYTVRVQACVVTCGQQVVSHRNDCADLLRRCRHLSLRLERASRDLSESSGGSLPPRERPES